jgi:hypothetical protein
MDGDASKASSWHVRSATGTQGVLALAASQTPRSDASDSFENGKSDDSSQKNASQGVAYSYSPLKLGSIRLLGLMPETRIDDTAKLIGT